MSGFRKVKYKDVIKALRKVGYESVRTKGSHARFEGPPGSKPVTIPVSDPSQMISRLVWSGLKSQLGDLFEQFEKAL